MDTNTNQGLSGLENLESYRRAYKIALTLGEVVLVDLILSSIGIPIISWILYPILNIFLSEETVFSIIGIYKVSFLLFFLIAIILNRKIKSIEKIAGTETPKILPSKGFKMTLKIILIPFGILLFIGILLNLIDHLNT